MSDVNEEVKTALKKTTRILWDIQEATGLPVLRKPLLELSSQLKMPPYHGYQMTGEPMAEETGGEESTDDVTTMTPRPQIVYVKESCPIQTPVIDEVKRLIQGKTLRRTVASLLRGRFPSEESKEKIETIKCPFCEKEWPKTMKYCSACGAALQEERRYHSPRHARVTL